MKTVRSTIFIFLGSFLLLLECQTVALPQVPPTLSQDGSPAPEPPKGPKPAPVTLEALVPTAAELPKGMRRVHGDHPASFHAWFFYEDPSHEGYLSPPIPVPKGKTYFSFVAKKGVPGTVYLFEYDEDGPRDAIAYLKGLLRGVESEHPTEEHPEEVIVHGRFLILISFPLGDPAAEWFKERLRKKFGIPAFRQRPDLLPLFQKIKAAWEKSDYDGEMRLFEKNAAAVADWSLGWGLRGELYEMKGDRLEQERAYRRALELHYGNVDPLEDYYVWSSLDGLGMALLLRRNLDSATVTLERAVAFAMEKGLDIKEQTSQSSYNLACAYALLKKYPEALGALKKAIAAYPNWKEYCRTDEDLVEALKRKEFQDLLK